MATYVQIKEWVTKNRGWTVQHDCWIAHCKELVSLFLPAEPGIALTMAAPFNVHLTRGKASFLHFAISACSTIRRRTEFPVATPIARS